MKLKFDPGLWATGEYLISIDSQYRVKLTQIFSNYSESLVEFQFHQWLKFLGKNDSIFSFTEHTPFVRGLAILRCMRRSKNNRPLHFLWKSGAASATEVTATFIPSLYLVTRALYHFQIYFAIMKINFALLKINFARMKVNFALMKINFAIMKINFAIMKINFAIMKINFHNYKIDLKMV